MNLTPRETEVLRLLAHGCTYSRIGDRLGVSLHTVTTHIKSIYRKLDVHCAAAAVRRAAELRVLDLGLALSSLMLLLAFLLAVLPADARARDGFTALAAATPMPEKRHALVIGNGNYEYATLKNPINDARAVARELSSAGFEVLLVEDATQAGMRRAVRLFGDSLQQGGVGLFYYAGHGMQVRGRNFLVPVNADIDREYEIEFNAVDVSLVLAMMEAAKNPLNIVILDACRNNPFARSLRVSSAGLAPLDAPGGTFIAFATAPGAIAADGTGDNGIYTKHLLEHIVTPGLQIEQLFKQVRIAVIAETRGEQTPWDSSSLRGDFSFRPGAASGIDVAAIVAEALRVERENRLKETDALIQAALERQRRQFEEQHVAVASVAPAGATPAGDSRFPQAGDRWTYRLKEWDRAGRPSERQYVATVAAASNRAVLDRVSIDGGPASEWAHGSGSYLVEQGAAVFAPYLSAFEQLSPGARLRKLTLFDGMSCKPPYICSARGRVAGRETITLPVGTFETIKVVIEHSWQPSSLEPGSSSINAELRGGRVLTVWYSPEMKRAVKYSSRLAYGRFPPMQANFELDLVDYQSRQPSPAHVAMKGGSK